MVNNGVSVVEKGSQLVVELQDREVKMLKGLGGELANVLLFPAATSRRGNRPLRSHRWRRHGRSATT
ncbi:hypothetical protein DMH27_05345 [Raoultella planticola]|nr:hypothetical protein [Raoultella planticola]